MKKILFVPLLFCMLSLRGQYDSLVNQNFDTTVTWLFGFFHTTGGSGDSTRFYSEIRKIRATAKAKGDENLAFLTEIFEEKYRFGSYSKEKLHETYLRLLDEGKRIGDLRSLALWEYLLADYYWIHFENYELALMHYLNTYEYLTQIKDEDYNQKQIQIYYVGERYFVFGDYTNTKYYLFQAMKVGNVADPATIISIYNTLGMTYLATNVLDSAEFYFKEALREAHNLHQEVWVGNLNGNIGNVLLKQGHYDSAQMYIRRDINMSIAKNDFGSACGAFMTLAGYNFKIGQPKKAIVLLDSALIVAKNWPNNRLKSLYPLLSKKYAYLGDWQKSMLYLDSTLMVRDSLAAKTNALQLLRVQQRTDLEEYLAELDKVEHEKKLKTLERNVLIFGFILALMGGFLLWRQMGKTNRAKKRSDELLLNILPSEVASELKLNGESPARKFNHVTVLFSDFKDFTKHSEDLAPEELVNTLDMYFKAFDEIMAEYGLEKIKTVGDAYICAAGLPNPDPRHAFKVVKAAIAMQDFMKSQATGWQLRVGIHSGPVVAGIVGVKKFAYDIWGDTVNTAARMEQNSEEGRINISQATYELVKNEIPCMYRGKIEAKNKGELDMYFVSPDA